MNDALRQNFGEKLLDIQEAYGEITIEVRPEDLLDIAARLRDEEVFKFVFLSDLTGIDCENGQFDVVYHLLSMQHQKRLRVKIRINESSAAPSVVSIWPTADWPEREAYDLLGISFDGHPNLKRLLTPDGFVGYPLRKDYPLKGEHPCR